MQETTTTIRHRQADDREGSQDLADRFRDLADQWEDESMFLSNSGHALALPSYDAIVKLGDQAVPLILKRMQTRGGHWYHALHDITKEDPVDPADWGNVAAMQAAWLRWGRDHGSIQVGRQACRRIPQAGRRRVRNRCPLHQTVQLHRVRGR